MKEWIKILRLPSCFPVIIGVSWYHDDNRHGPNMTKRIWGMDLVKLGMAVPSTGYRLWVYTPWRSPYVELRINRSR